MVSNRAPDWDYDQWWTRSPRYGRDQLLVGVARRVGAVTALAWAAVDLVINKIPFGFFFGALVRKIETFSSANLLH